MSESRARVLLMFVMALGSLALLGYLVVALRHEAAIGAVLSLAGLAGSYVFRGRVETPKS